MSARARSCYMARRPRLIYPQVAAHIIQRGNNRNACFRADGDYLTYLAHLRHLARKYHISLHAYCLMTNHTHLLLTPETADSCSAFMRDLGRCYVPYFNRRYGRTGTLWEGRFHACLAESARYVLACYRYVELNPVRACMVADAGSYPWSSFRANTGTCVDASLVPHMELLALGAGEVQRRDAYKQLFDSALENDLVRSIRQATQTGYPLASDEFIARIGAKTRRDKPGPKVRPVLHKLRP